MPSKNDNIFYAKEEFISIDRLNDMSIELEENINQSNIINTIKILERYVSGFKYNNS